MDETVFSRIRVVLVGTTHPGNIGAVARAMKTMWLERLYLVAPKRFPCAEATARATGADDVLYTATVCDTLEDALTGCGWVVGTSARPRSIAWPEYGPRDCAARVISEARQTEVAIVFGREHSGLTNAELDRCHAMVRIPTHPAYRSLNLAAAVQVLAYEVQMACRVNVWKSTPADSGDSPASIPVRTEEMEGFYGHLEEALTDIGYLDPTNPKRLMRRLRRLFNRVMLDRSELNILRGILVAVQRVAKRRS